MPLQSDHHKDNHCPRPHHPCHGKESEELKLNLQGNQNWVLFFAKPVNHHRIRKKTMPRERQKGGTVGGNKKQRIRICLIKYKIISVSHFERFSTNFKIKIITH